MMAYDVIRCDAPFRTRLDNNGQTSILARDGYDVIDPTATIIKAPMFDTAERLTF